jgi:hypothetical protein
MKLQHAEAQRTFPRAVEQMHLCAFDIHQDDMGAMRAQQVVKADHGDVHTPPATGGQTGGGKVILHAKCDLFPFDGSGHHGTVKHGHILCAVAGKVVFDDRDEGRVGLHRQDVLGRGPARADRGNVADARPQFEYAEAILHAAFGGVGLIGLIGAIPQALGNKRCSHGGRQMDVDAVDFRVKAGHAGTSGSTPKGSAPVEIRTFPALMADV